MKKRDSSESCSLGREPQWDLPADSREQAGWSPMEIRTTRFPGHPQETTENAVDLAHFRYVHGYDNVNRSQSVPVWWDGPCLESRFDFKSTRKVAKIATITLDFSTSTFVFGLGYSFVEIREHSVAMDMRLWVLATPVDGTLIDLTLVSQSREIRNPQRRILGLGFLPPRLRAPIMNKIIAAIEKRDVQQDAVIWKPQEVPVASASLLFRRRDYALSSLLRSVLSRSEDSTSPLPETPDLAVSESSSRP